MSDKIYSFTKKDLARNVVTGEYFIVDSDIYRTNQHRHKPAHRYRYCIRIPDLIRVMVFDRTFANFELIARNTEYNSEARHERDKG